MKKSLYSIIFLIGSISLINETILGQQQQQQQRQETQKKCSITFDPKGYTGTYYLLKEGVEEKPEYSGKQPLDLSSGSFGIYTLEIGGIGYPDSQIVFKVSDDCTVSQLNKPAKPPSVLFNEKTITFKNVTVEIEPQDYEGIFYLKGFPRNKPLNGKRTFVVVPNVNSSVSLYGTGIGSEINFFIEDDGKLSKVDNFTAAYPCNNKLTFNNVKIDVNPTTHAGKYKLGGVQRQGKIFALVVIPGITLPVVILDNTEKNTTPWVNIIYPASVEIPDNNKKKHKFSFCLVP